MHTKQLSKESLVCKIFVVCGCWRVAQATFCVGCHIHARVLSLGGALGRCSMMSMGLPHLGHLKGVLIGSGLSTICFLGATLKKASMMVKVAFARGCMKP